MPELTNSLYQWESRAFERERFRQKKAATRLAIDLSEDETVISGPIEIIRKITHEMCLPNFEELPGGFARTYYADPVPNRGRQIVNALIHKIWRKRK